MLRRVLRHLSEYRFRLVFYYRELEEHSCVEHHVGIFLIREYPFVLSGTHRSPAAYGVLCRTTTVFIVADDASQQTVVGCWDVIMVVQKNRCQCRCISSPPGFVPSVQGSGHEFPPPRGCRSRATLVFCHSPVRLCRCGSYNVEA